jgi:hypothetical protein
MAYSALPAKSSSDTLTLGNYNAIKGNFEAGVPDIFTAKGDLAAGTAADTAAPLAVGNDDDILVPDSSESTGLAWQIQPAARVRNSGAIDPATSSWVTLTFDTEVFDVNGMHSTVSNTSRLTVPTDGDGLYLIGGNVKFDTSGTATGSSLKGVQILLNGATTIAQNLIGVVHSSYDITIQVQTLYSLSAADYVELRVYTNSDVNVLTGATSPVFWATWQRRQ